MIDAFLRGGAGRSATRRYRSLSHAWRRRVFGRRFGVYFWIIYALLAMLVASWHPSTRVTLWAGIALGGVAALWLLLPDALGPSSIGNWQLGAWGEQNTASELRPLKREGWTVAHDVRWGERGNHDHVVAGPAVYVLNSKNVKDSRVTVEGDGLRVTQIESGDAYLADRWLPTVEAEARSLKRLLDRVTGFPVWVYPVVVIWGGFEERSRYLGEVAVVCGDELAAFLRSRPADLLTAEKRATVARAVRALPRA